MSFTRYFSETRDADGDKLWWPGGPDGFPYRGETPPLLKSHEFAAMQLSYKFRCRTFYLAKREDHAQYIKIREKCANSYFFALDRDRQWDEETKDYKIYLEWIEPAYELPVFSVLGASYDVSKDTNAITIPYAQLKDSQD